MSLVVAHLPPPLADLDLPARVERVANSALAQRVSTYQGSQAWVALPSKPVTTLALVGPWYVRGIDVLHEVGIATTPGGQHEHLVVSGWWAILRYLWAFRAVPEHQTHRLALSGIATDVRRHHRAVLSENLGLGFGSLLATSAVLRNHQNSSVRLADVEQAMTFGVPNYQGTVTAGSLWPDLLLVSTSSTEVRLTGLECKGSSSASRVTEQLAKAVRQLASLQVDGSTPPGIAVSTVSNESGVDVYAVDPESDERWTFGRSSLVDRQPIAAGERPTVPADLAVHALWVSTSKILSWTGHHAEARRWLMQDGAPIIDDGPRGTIRWEIGESDYRGREVVSRVEGVGEITVFAGLRSDLLEELRGVPTTERALASIDLARERPESAVGTETDEWESDASGDFEVDEDGSITATSVAGDGRALIIHVRPEDGQLAAAITNDL